MYRSQEENNPWAVPLGGSLAKAAKAYSPAICRGRRARFIKYIQSQGGGVAIIPSSAEILRNRDTHYPYRQDSYLHYLTGFPEPQAILVLWVAPASLARPKGKGKVSSKISSVQSLLFCRPKDTEREIWDGFRYGPKGAADHFGLDEAYSITEWEQKLPSLLAGAERIFYTMGCCEEIDKQLLVAMKQVRGMARAGQTVPDTIHDPSACLDEMRLVKDVHEINCMREAGNIASLGHKRAMQRVRPGCYEYELEAELLYEFRRHGASAEAYPSIVAAGANACVLHYVSNRAEVKDGDLVLIDAGCELYGYASDITRTFPANGRFSGAQKDLYELVLSAQKVAISAVRPGAAFDAPHRAACRVLAQGMLDTGLLKGSLDSVLEQGDKREGGYFRFYMHRTSHWLGLDVHDAGPYQQQGKTTSLAEGQVLTIEPGLYVRPAKGVPEIFWHIGIRIEDDVLVTSKGHEVLTKDCPKSIADISSCMKEASA